MQIKDSRFHKVWKIEIDQNGNKKVNLGDSKKNQDGTYTSWTWFFCKLVGNAKGIHLDEGDTITITSGKIEQYKAQDGTYRNSITIFDLEVTARSNQANSSPNNGYNAPTGQKQSNPASNTQANFEDTIPF